MWPLLVFVALLAGLAIGAAFGYRVGWEEAQNHESTPTE